MEFDYFIVSFQGSTPPEAVRFLNLRALNCLKLILHAKNTHLYTVRCNYSTRIYFSAGKPAWSTLAHSLLVHKCTKIAVAHVCVNSHIHTISLVYRLTHFIECMIHYRWEFYIAEIDCVSGEFSIRVIEVTALLEYFNLEHLQCSLLHITFSSDNTLERWFEDGL